MDTYAFIIDTPLHGFDDGMNEDMLGSMRSSRYRYFMNHQDEGQFIVIENYNYIPHIDYDAAGATVIIFRNVDAPVRNAVFE